MPGPGSEACGVVPANGARLFSLSRELAFDAVGGTKLLDARNDGMGDASRAVACILGTEVPYERAPPAPPNEAGEPDRGTASGREGPVASESPDMMLSLHAVHTAVRGQDSILSRIVKVLIPCEQQKVSWSG